MALWIWMKFTRFSIEPISTVMAKLTLRNSVVTLKGYRLRVIDSETRDNALNPQPLLPGREKGSQNSSKSLSRFGRGI
ncbi:hypothetical protein PROH_00275 [Prochlorothrix hollandica PCC 9006 = CALU 1027]|uniref:Uncharacterized protein n=1 Tax=Prochlorothrix hollandica PCC 9006 = CALU 1027 TaxID=317619 RepID=A0A0M2PXN1_PROHO|nr:hypothetical protein PROH_00275 [Prochlorothrix hollandica PCC 9006 = CALU 1027]